MARFRCKTQKRRNAYATSIKNSKSNVLYKNEEGNFVVIGDENNAADVVSSLLADVRKGTLLDSFCAADVIIDLILHEFKVVKPC